MRGWLRRGGYAARLAGDRADLWPAGALAALAYLGWLPLLVVVAEPRVEALSYFGVSVVTAGAYPANVVALAVALVGAILLLCLVAAGAEAALLRMAAAPSPSPPPLRRMALSGLAVFLVAALPALAAAAATVLALTAVAVDAFLAPGRAGVALRLAAAVWPYLAGLAVCVVLGQAFGAVALRRALAVEPTTVTAALLSAAQELVRTPVARFGVALAGWVSDAAVLLLSWAVLRVLWAPIAQELSAGGLASAETLLLLVGFVAIWLALLLAAGAVHVAISAWWALELARTDSVQRAAAAPAPRPDPRGGTST
ncbi:MAG: hypothetical protein ACRDHD_05880 [Candidatus Limnocylindria bacterium]